ncbi:bifunctional hydroxymethylpyrimidine kinase/phosphomethylpyrimidine kinase [Desulfurobacterium thermolithotrophum]|uniref:bifunctional hydroxymethylpyrimidine kinase/phosphomethylpyrimidine kinase n=1 Tax=Desulfurobacterium thermolithotrophum TaxID=64160 RepID=UPI0013D00C09|nr:bifunctional hydroxymethylpyrimidine kinase/phosphomethylpyrimidine kinase [Desulfurobacterium thermolithotrophum]
MADFLLTIAGFDPTGGAGILRDIRVFNHFGFFGTAVITVNTAQNTKGVKLFQFENEELVLKQLDLILEEIQIKGIKIGIPHVNKNLNKKIAETISSLKVPVVFDPVISPTFGKDFLKDLKVIEPLISVSSVITPNKREYELLKPLLKNSKGYIALKGIEIEDYVEDRLIKDNEIVKKVKHKKDKLIIRGTGCAFSSALISLIVKEKLVTKAFLKASKFLEIYRKEHFQKSDMLQGYSTV